MKVFIKNWGQENSSNAFSITIPENAKEASN